MYISFKITITELNRNRTMTISPSIHRISSAITSRRVGNPVLTCCLIILLLLTAYPAHCIELTNAKHLFDIAHDFSQPSDLSVSEDGQIYVVDGVNNMIKVFDQKGAFKFSFGEKGVSDGQFMFPLGIDIDSTGNIYIADSGNHRIQIFNSKGKYLNRIDIPASNANPADPTDVAVSTAADRLYVADNDNHYILIYRLSDLKLIKTFGSPGSEEKEFRYPFLMSLDNENYLYISDVINTRVQVISKDGLFVNVIGGWGVQKGRFFRPKGVTVDMDNLVYISDSYMGVIQIFGPDGEFHSVIGNPAENSVKKFIKPMGIFIDKNNRLYVVEMFAERVGVYQIEK